MKSRTRRGDHLWRFVTNHAHVLQCIGANPDARLRDIAATVGITERAAAGIVSDLEQAGYLTRSREGRRNRYEVHDELPLRHPQHRHHTVGDLIGFLEEDEETRPSGLARGRHGRRRSYDGHGQRGLGRAGETKQVTWRFTDPGEVMFGCHEPGHYDGGMVGTISVN